MITQAFVDDLALVINKHSAEQDSNTPDFILAAFAANVIVAYGNALKERKRWYAEDAVCTPIGIPARTQDPEFLDIRHFHTKFNQIVNFEPTFISLRLAEERFKFMQEELKEWWEKGVLKHDMDEIADGLIDLVYVAKGTAVMYGLPWRDLWEDVQRANLAKVPKVTHRGTTHDVGKPEGWVPPQTTQILREAGYHPDHCWRDEDYEDSGIMAYQGPVRTNGGTFESSGETTVLALNPGVSPLGANCHGLGPDVGDGSNPDYTLENPIGGVER